VAWDCRTGKEIARLSGHGSAVTCVAASGDGRLAVTGSEDGGVRVWSVSTGTELAAFQADAPIQACSATADARAITAACQLGHLYFLRLEPES
jgi:WD40 repeat protein